MLSKKIKEEARTGDTKQTYDPMVNSLPKKKTLNIE